MFANEDSLLRSHMLSPHFEKSYGQIHDNKVSWNMNENTKETVLYVICYMKMLCVVCNMIFMMMHVALMA